MKGFSMLAIMVGVAVVVSAVVVIAAGLVVYLVSVITLKFFGVGGVEIIGAFNKPYIVANTLANSNVDGKPLLDPMLAAAMTKMTPSSLSKFSSYVKDMLDSYDFPYMVSLEGVTLAEAACARGFSAGHKAADVSASCGAPVRSFCSGQLSTIGPGLSGDPVFGGTASGGSEGLQIEHDDGCELSDYRSLYGCVIIPDRKSRHVVKGEIIGYVSTCGAEKEQGCHLHYAITKGAISAEEDPNICDKINRVVQQGVNVIAAKGDVGESALQTEAFIPLIFKDSLRKTVVTIGER